MVDLNPGSLGVPALSALYADGIELSAAAQVLESQGRPSTAAANDHRFWATPPRRLNDTHMEALYVNLAKPRLMNYLALDLPHFPQHTYLHFWNAQKKDWEEVRGENGYAIRFYIDGAVPRVIGSAAAQQQGLHPSHHGADHWLHYDVVTRPFTASRIRLTTTRSFGSRQGGPIDPGGRDAPYSLGVRNLDFGYRVTKKQDVPLANRDPDIVTERETFTTVLDLLGSPVELKMRENRASDLLQGRIWKSEPQPFSYAVVNLYVDSRDSAGRPQTIDRFDIDPITSGVRLNLYYSTDPPDVADFTADDTPLSFPFTRSAGVSEPSMTASGMRFPDEISFLDVDNQAVQWNPSRPFWLAMEVLPQFSSTETADHVLFDCGPFQVAWRDGVWQLAFEGGALWQQPFDFDYNERLVFTVAYDGENVFFYTPKADSAATFPADLSSLTCTVLRFGAEAGLAVEEVIVTGKFTLRAFVLKQELPAFDTGPPFTAPAGVDRFAGDSWAYLDKPQFAHDEDGSTTNALLRFKPSFALGTTADQGLNPFGFVGGPGDVYDDVTWIPVNRDFILRKGSLKFDPVPASCFKFEFTQLQAQPHDLFMPVSRKVKTYPVEVVSHSMPSVRNSVAAANAGLTANAEAVAQVGTFSDVSQILTSLAVPESYPALPTEALYATDPDTAERLQAFGGVYNFHPWQPTATAPQFTGVQQHHYQTVEIQHRSRIAYFAAISSLEMHRVDYLGDDDTDQYLELFHDDLHLSPDADGDLPLWVLGPGRLRTPFDLTDPARTTSVTMGSRRKVRGIQYATQQSAPVQLLFDPDFDDPLFRAWRPIGDAAPLELAEEYNSAVGSTARLSRSLGRGVWSVVESTYPTWDAIEESTDGPLAPTWDDLESLEGDTAYGGVAYKTSIPTTRAGRLYAAARVIAPGTLSQPLTLQIVDSNGAVLAAAEREVSGGRVTEWHVGYTIGEGGEENSETWDDIEGTSPTWNDLQVHTWDSIDSTIAPLDGEVSVQLIQRGNTADEWFVDNVSLYEDAIVWEFSNDGGENWWPVYDIRNDPRGVFIFPTDPSPGPSSGVGLRWRVTGHRPNLNVSALAVRPWYGAMSFGVPSRETGLSGGPMINPTDHFPRVEDDPRWKVWHEPIPQDWYFLYRRLLELDRERVTPGPGSDDVLSPVYLQETALLPGEVVGTPIGPEIFEDLYTDGYGFVYGVEAGADVYTDNFGNNTY